MSHEDRPTGPRRPRAVAALGVLAAAAILVGGCRAPVHGVEKGTMQTISSRDAAQAFAPRVEAFLDTLPLRREKFEVRANRCAGSEGEQRNDIYTVWVGLQAVAPGNDAARVLGEVHDRWRDDGWEITRWRRLENGGINLGARDPDGNDWVLDSGFAAGPESYVVGFFNTPCMLDPSGAVDFGPIAARADLVR